MLPPDVFPLSDLVVEILHDSGTSEKPAWKVGSGFLIGGNLVLTAAHNVDVTGELLVRFRGSEEYAAAVSTLPSGRSALDPKCDFAVLEITSTNISHRPRLHFARIDDKPTLETPNIEGCWAIGFPRFQEKARLDRDKPLRDSARVDGSILMGEGLVEGLLTLSVTRLPRDLEHGDLSESPWQGMSGALVFAGSHAVGLITEHHIPAGGNSLTLTPLSVLDKHEDATAWWRLLGVEDFNTLLVLPSNQRWDFYLIHSEVDRLSALELYEVLSPHARVFLDERSIIPGDNWSRVLPVVLKQSRIIVVLVSPNTRNAWYENSEIRITIDLLRDFSDRYRVITLLLDNVSPIHRSNLPYGLEQTVSISLSECGGGWQQVIQRLLDTLHFGEGERHHDEVNSSSSSSPVALVDSTTALVGETEKGPTWPILLTSWEDYLRYFGHPLDLERTYLSIAVRGFFENGGERAYVARVVGYNASRAMVHIPTEDPNQYLIVSAQSVSAQDNCILIRAQRGSRIGVRLSVERTIEPDTAWLTGNQQGRDQIVLEDFDNLSLTAPGPNPLVDVINRKSEWISVEWAQADSCPSMPITGNWHLISGSDGQASVRDYLGMEELPGPDRMGLSSLALLADIGIICVPDAVHSRFTPNEREELIRAILVHCERHKRFAILSHGSEQGEHNVPTAPADSSSAAIYCPWITVPNVFREGAVSVPAIGHIAGAYARHDRQYGVHVSPVGIELNGLVTDSAELAFAQPIDSNTVDTYTRHGVNIIGQDPKNPHRFILASAVTMAIDDSWRRIGSRRFFNYVERCLEAGTAWVLFAPNSEDTWTQIREEVEKFFTRLWRAGVFLGSTPEEAFFVRCDRNTMTEDDIANQRINLVIGVALADRDLNFPQPPTIRALGFPKI